MLIWCTKRSLQLLDIEKSEFVSIGDNLARDCSFQVFSPRLVITMQCFIDQQALLCKSNPQPQDPIFFPIYASEKYANSFNPG